MSEELWYVRKSGKVTGPFNKTQLDGLRRRGLLGQFHEVSRDKQDWVSAATLIGSGAVATVATVAAVDGGFAVQEPAMTAPPAPDWFYSDGGEQAGPVSAQQIHALIKASRLGPDTQVWRDGFPAWIALRDVAEFAGLLGTRPAGGAAAAPSGEGTAARPARRGAHRRAVLSAGIASLIVVAVIGFVLVDRYRTGRLKWTAIGTEHVINSLDDRNKEIEQAVGFVLCGYRVVFDDGSVLENWENSGTCFAVSDDGYLLTNRHVIREVDRRGRMSPEARTKEFRMGRLAAVKREREQKTANDAKLSADDEQQLKDLEALYSDPANFQSVDPKVWVFFGSKQVRHEARVVHVSSLDMGILKVDRKDSPFFSLAPPEEMPARMTKVFALGFPGTSQEATTMEDALVQRVKYRKNPGRVQEQFPDTAFAFTTTEGIVSRTATTADGQVIQHTAAINPGNSGGPLVTPDAKVIAINTSYMKGAKDASATLYSLTMPQFLSEVKDAIEQDRVKAARADDRPR